MSTADLSAALDVPVNARIDRRMPKTLFVEHGAPTAADSATEGERLTLSRMLAHRAATPHARVAHRSPHARRHVTAGRLRSLLPYPFRRISST